MALRTKTIEYGFSSLGNTATVTRGTLGNTTLYIPETTSRTFKSVTLDAFMRGAETAAASLTSLLLGVQLGGAANSDQNTVVTITNSGDQQSYVATRDVTAYFTSNFGSGTSQPCSIAFQTSGLATTGFNAKLIITYEYDDTDTTRIKTVRIPINSGVLLTTSLASIGFPTQIPALDSFLPEASKTYRNIFFESHFSDAGNSTADFWYQLALDAEAANSRFMCEQGLNSAVYGRDIWVRNDMTTSATHDLKGASLSVTARFALPAVVLVVTYEYDHSSTTNVINSLVMAGADESSFSGSTVTGDRSEFWRYVNIQEPGTPLLTQSGNLCFITDPATITMNTAIGVQNGRTYTLTAGSVQVGPYTYIHRFDSGSGCNPAEGVTLERGDNYIPVKRFTATTPSGTNFSSIMYLNYYSGVHPDGDGVHNHSTHWCLWSQGATLAKESRIAAPNTLFALANSYYYTSGMLMVTAGNMIGAAATAITVQMGRSAEMTQNTGWVDLIICTQMSDAEQSPQITAGAIADVFYKYPNMKNVDPSKANTLVTHNYRWMAPTTGWLGSTVWWSFHGITYTISGNTTNTNGGTVTLSLMQANTHEYLDTQQVTGNSAFTFRWYDNVSKVYVTAKESGTSIGRSDDGFPVGW